MNTMILNMYLHGLHRSAPSPPPPFFSRLRSDMLLNIVYVKYVLKGQIDKKLDFNGLIYIFRGLLATTLEFCYINIFKFAVVANMPPFFLGFKVTCC